MKYKLLGRTGLKVSELCLGTMTFGGGDVIGGLGQKEATELVSQALDAGVNFFDTADAYGGGAAEEMLGRALDGRRHDVVVATKVRLKSGDGPNAGGLSRWHIHRAVEASLARLGTDYVDFYLMHIEDTLTPIDETLRAFEDLVRAGKVRYVGCSNLMAWQIMQALGIAGARGWTRFEVVQAYYNLAARDLEREIVPLVRDQQLGLMVWSPLAGGLLSGKYTPDGEGPGGARRSRFDFPPVDRARAFAVIDVLRELAAAHEATVPRLALAWLLHQAPVTSVIVGARRPEQLADNLLAAGVDFSADELARLDEVSALPPEYPGWMLRWDWDERVRKD